MTDLLYAGFLGLIAGFIPVYVGLAPLRFVRRLSEGTRTVLVSFSAGILLFLFADVTVEGMEHAKAPSSSPALFLLGLLLGLLGPLLISQWAARRRIAAAGEIARGRSSSTMPSPKLFMAYTIAMGIGMHNLGEGLAIGAAYAEGTLGGLTALLVIGFFLHNSTEGLGMTAPLASVRTGWREPLLLGFFAGFPTILGSMIGSLANSPALEALFFAAAAGALLYVIVELIKIAYAPERMRSAYGGMVLGILVMYLTGLLVP